MPRQQEFSDEPRVRVSSIFDKRLQNELQSRHPLDTRFQRFTDLNRALTALILGFGCMQIPRLMRTDDAGARRLTEHCAFFIAGMVMGIVGPRHAWRWAFACAFIVPLMDFVGLMGASIDGSSMLHVAGLLWLHRVEYAMRFLPALVGVYSGVYLRWK